MTELGERDVYEIEEREYVRKAEVDEDVKESRLQTESVSAELELAPCSYDGDFNRDVSRR